MVIFFYYKSAIYGILLSFDLFSMPKLVLITVQYQCFENYLIAIIKFLLFGKK